MRPVGELDMDTVEALDAQIRESLRGAVRRLVLDLRGVQFIDSTGLHLVLGYDAEARQNGFALELVSGDRAAQRVFESPAPRRNSRSSTPDRVDLRALKGPPPVGRARRWAG